jgi:hypothetical protein
MRLAHRQAQPQFIARREDQMDVVRHQAAGPDLDAAPLHLLAQEVTVER